MNADEIVRALRCVQEKHRNDHLLTFQTDVSAMARYAADLIESLQAQLAASQRRAQDARNELCLKCGRYRESHNGACNGCRWKEPKSEQI